MNPFLKRTPLLHVGTALVFATVTLIVSFRLGNFKHKGMIMLLILGLYFIPAGIIEKLKPTDEPPQA